MSTSVSTVLAKSPVAAKSTVSQVQDSTIDRDSTELPMNLSNKSIDSDGSYPDHQRSMSNSSMDSVSNDSLLIPGQSSPTSTPMLNVTGEFEVDGLNLTPVASAVAPTDTVNQRAQGSSVDENAPKPQSYASVATSSRLPVSWRDARDSTIAIRLTRGYRFSSQKAFDWISTLPLNIWDYKPVSAGLVNKGWEFHITFDSREKALNLLKACRGTCMIDGEKHGNVSLTNENICSMRIHWLPMWIDNESVKKQLDHVLKSCVDENVKVLDVKQGQEESPWGKIQATFRQATVSFPLGIDAGETPGTMNVYSEKMYPALISVLGLKPVCLKCSNRGHMRSECPYPCRRCAAANTPEGHRSKMSHTTSEHEEYMKSKEPTEKASDNSTSEKSAANAESKDKATVNVDVNIDNDEGSESGSDSGQKKRKKMKVNPSEHTPQVLSALTSSFDAIQGFIFTSPAIVAPSDSPPPTPVKTPNK